MQPHTITTQRRTGSATRPRCPQSTAPEATAATGTKTPACPRRRCVRRRSGSPSPAADRRQGSECPPPPTTADMGWQARTTMSTPTVGFTKRYVCVAETSSVTSMSPLTPFALCCAAGESTSAVNTQFTRSSSAGSSTAVCDTQGTSWVRSDGGGGAATDHGQGQSTVRLRAGEGLVVALARLHRLVVACGEHPQSLLNCAHDPVPVPPPRRQQSPQDTVVRLRRWRSLHRRAAQPHTDAQRTCGFALSLVGGVSTTRKSMEAMSDLVAARVVIRWTRATLLSASTSLPHTHVRSFEHTQTGGRARGLTSAAPRLGTRQLQWGRPGQPRRVVRRQARRPHPLRTAPLRPSPLHRRCPSPPHRSTRTRHRRRHPPRPLSKRTHRSVTAAARGTACTLWAYQGRRSRRDHCQRAVS